MLYQQNLEGNTVFKVINLKKKAILYENWKLWWLTQAKHGFKSAWNCAAKLRLTTYTHWCETLTQLLNPHFFFGGTRDGSRCDLSECTLLQCSPLLTVWRTKLQFCCTGHVDTKSQLAGWATNCCRFTFYSHWLIQSTAQVFIPTTPMQVAKVSFSVLSVLNSTVLFCFQILIIHNLWRFLACPNRKGCRSTLSTKHLWLVKLTDVYILVAFNMNPTVHRKS